MLYDITLFGAVYDLLTTKQLVKKHKLFQVYKVSYTHIRSLEIQSIPYNLFFYN